MVKRINISASNVLYEDKVKDMIYPRQLNLFTNHQNMSQKDRAAQFAPFAALTGHKQLIHETQRITEEKREIDENKQQILNQKLNYFIETKEKVKITYFKKDARKAGGSYQTMIQSIKKLDMNNKIITLQNKQIINLSDIYEIEAIDHND